MNESKYECLSCGNVIQTSEDNEPEECHTCGEHKPERFEIVKEK